MLRVDPSPTNISYRWRRTVVHRVATKMAPRSTRRRALALAALVVIAAMCRLGTAAEDDSALSFPVASDSSASADVQSSKSIFTDAKLFVTEDSPFRRQATAWRRTRPRDAGVMDALASKPQAIWLGEWNEQVTTDVAEVMRSAAASGSLPVFVVYFIPQRDCGEYSHGGAVSAAFYREWTGGIARAIGDGRAAVILEPDALAGMNCLTPAQQTERVALIREAVHTFASLPNAAVYVDAGHAKWLDASEMARRLRAANIAEADGFTLNISNFITTAESIEYGERISRATGGKHFLIDTSRNGLGPAADAAWCNPPGRAVGTAPTVRTGHDLVDALLWVKRPGESDGECNGGPAAGVWWPEYALDLARRGGL